MVCWFVCYFYFILQHIVSVFKLFAKEHATYKRIYCFVHLRSEFRILTSGVEWKTRYYFCLKEPELVAKKPWKISWENIFQVCWILFISRLVAYKELNLIKRKLAFVVIFRRFNAFPFCTGFTVRAVTMYLMSNKKEVTLIQGLWVKLVWILWIARIHITLTLINMYHSQYSIHSVNNHNSQHIGQPWKMDGNELWFSVSLIFINNF